MSCFYRDSSWCIRAYRDIEAGECDGCAHRRKRTPRKTRQMIDMTSHGGRLEVTVRGYTDEWPTYWRRP